MLHLLHFQCFRIGSCSRFFTQHMLACAHCVDCDRRMHLVRRADGHRFYLRVSQYVMIIFHCDSAAVLLYRLFCALRDNIAEIFDFHIFIFHISRDMCAVRDRSAANNAYCYFFHIHFPFF